MVRLTLMLLLLAMTGAVLAGCQSAVDADEMVSQGELIYIENCARCHQAGGEGYVPLYPNLNNNPVATLHDPLPVIQVVKYGRASMPPFRNLLTSEEIAAVASYIRNAWDNDASIVTPKQAR